MFENLTKEQLKEYQEIGEITDCEVAYPDFEWKGENYEVTLTQISKGNVFFVCNHFLKKYVGTIDGWALSYTTVSGCIKTKYIADEMMAIEQFTKIVNALKLCNV